MFHSQSEAKRFFIDKVILQARADSEHLSQSEEWMLGFSESDPEFSVDPAIMRAFEMEVAPQDYEAKIARLLRRRYRQDAESDAETVASYRAAYARLLEGDHYLTVMLERALGHELRSGARLSALLAP